MAKEWFYKAKNGKVEGPYKGDTLNGWWKSGAFDVEKNTLLLKHLDEKEYTLLKDLVARAPEGESPFTRLVRRAVVSVAPQDVQAPRRVAPKAEKPKPLQGKGPKRRAIGTSQSMSLGRQSPSNKNKRKSKGIKSAKSLGSRNSLSHVPYLYIELVSHNEDGSLEIRPSTVNALRKHLLGERHKPVRTLAFGGPARIGKSALMNNLLHYVLKLESLDDPSLSELAGQNIAEKYFGWRAPFQVGDTTNVQTMGANAAIVVRKDHILVCLDTEGTRRGDKTFDERLSTLVALVVDKMVLQTRGDLQQDTISDAGLLAFNAHRIARASTPKEAPSAEAGQTVSSAAVSSAGEKKSEASESQHGGKVTKKELLYLIRDFGLKLIGEGAAEGKQQILKERMAMASKGGGDGAEYVQAIDRYFESDLEVLPHPGGADFQNPHFLEQVVPLFPKLITFSRPVLQHMTAQRLPDMLAQLIAQVNAGDFNRAGVIQQILEKESKAAMDEALNRCEKLLQEPTIKLKIIAPEEFEVLLKGVLTKVEACFTAQMPPDAPKITADFLAVLRKKAEHLLGNAREVNSLKWRLRQEQLRREEAERKAARALAAEAAMLAAEFSGEQATQAHLIAITAKADWVTDKAIAYAVEQANLAGKAVSDYQLAHPPKARSAASCCIIS